MSMVRVARFADLTEAQVVVSALKAADIPVLLQNELAGQTNFLWQAAMGGFAILVPQEHAAEAVSFIRQHRTENFHAPRPDDVNADIPALADDEDWGRGARRRRAMIIRWIVVSIFLGPNVLLIANLVLRGMVSAFTGR
jgi:hypothetical protein